MALEDFVSVKLAEKRPFTVFLLASAVSIAAFLIAYFIFPSNSGLIVVFLITMGLLPLFNLLLEFEEMKDMYSKEHKIGFLKRHSDIIRIYTAFFFGTAITLALLSSFSSDVVNQAVFSNQIEELDYIQSSISGNFFNPSLYSEIIINNLKVVGIAFLLSFVFGTGALYVLSWNASILAVLVSSITRTVGPHGIATGFLTFLPHGILEITGFFLSGIAAAILGKSIFHRKSKAFGFILLDGVVMFILAVVLILIAGAVEVLLI